MSQVEAKIVIISIVAPAYPAGFIVTTTERIKHWNTNVPDYDTLDIYYQFIITQPFTVRV